MEKRERADDDQGEGGVHLWESTLPCWEDVRVWSQSAATCFPDPPPTAKSDWSVSLKPSPGDLSTICLAPPIRASASPPPLRLSSVTITALELITFYSSLPSFSFISPTLFVSSVPTPHRQLLSNPTFCDVPPFSSSHLFFPFTSPNPTATNEIIFFFFPFLYDSPPQTLLSRPHLSQVLSPCWLPAWYRKAIW